MTTYPTIEEAFKSNLEEIEDGQRIDVTLVDGTKQRYERAGSNSRGPMFHRVTSDGRAIGRPINVYGENVKVLETIASQEDDKSGVDPYAHPNTDTDLWKN